MRRWALLLVLLAAALCWQPSAKADDDRDYWRYRHHGWRHRHYDEDRADRYYWRRRHYGDWRDRRDDWRYRHHRRPFIEAGPVLIER
jgi:hypothetical protein